MAITTVAGAVSGMTYAIQYVKPASGTIVVGRPHSLFYLGGYPAAAAAPSPGIGGAVLTSYTNQIPFTNPTSGNTYLARFSGMANQTGTLMLCDRLWHNSGIDETSTAEQTFTSSAQIPARDMNGTNSGHGVLAAVEVSTATGAGTPVITFKYTDQDGNPDVTATEIVTTVASSVAGSFYPIALASGDTGVQLAQSIQYNATWTQGETHLVLYRVLSRLEIKVANTPFANDALTCGFVRAYDNTVPFLVWIPTNNNSTGFSGEIIWTQG